MAPQVPASFVVTLFEPSEANGGDGSQPLVGVFTDTPGVCSLVYALPSHVQGGPLYAYSDFDEGSFPEITLRVILLNMYSNEITIV